MNHRSEASLAELIASNRISVDNLYGAIYNIISSSGQSCDYFECIDLYLYGENSFRDLFKADYLIEMNAYGLETQSRIINYTHAQYPLLYALNSKKFACPYGPLKYWTGKVAKLFWHPLLIGYSSQNQLLPALGWGSLSFGSFLSSYLEEKIVITGNIGVVLTRHPSKYAHFIRDRLTKILWLQKYCSNGPFDTIIVDYPLSKSELDALEDFGISAKLIFASHYQTMLLSGNIVIIECTNGMPLLSLLRKHLNLIDSKPANDSSKIFLKRGDKGNRRDFSNNDEIEALFHKLNYKIVETSGMSIIDQLMIANGSRIACGLHGAQLINAIMTSKLIELHSFPYIMSSWSHTMNKMAEVLSVPYIPLLIGDCLGQDASSKKIKNLIQFASLDNNLSGGQTHSIYADIGLLGKSIRIAESLLD